VTLSLNAGVTVDSAAETISRASGQHVAILSGGNEVMPFSMANTTPWQVLARLSRLPGVTIAVYLPNGEFRKVQQFPSDEIISLCSEGASLRTVLDGLSRDVGAIFEASGPLTSEVVLTSKATLEEIVKQLSAQTGTAITVVP
jgi:hypothetical protein